MRATYLISLAAFAATALSGLVPVERADDTVLIDARAPQDTNAVGRPGCTNAKSRLCWDGRYDINTNYYTSGPRTGKTVTYYFDIKNVTVAPDGRPRMGLAINGKIPAPTIVANWGDRIVVHVKNSMQHNGTSIHWHGIRQLRNFLNDGVNGVTECPTAPQDTRTYSFIAEQYGTTWFHSHYSAQWGDGVVGTLQINGPATEEYDIDLGPVMLSEWFAFQTAFQKAYAAERTGPPVPDNFIVNGINVNPSNTTQGKRFQLKFVPGKKHRIRFVNTSVDTFFRVSLDGHNMTVIQTDFVPIKSFQAETIGIAIGQRYDVIITANQNKSNYWLRTLPQAACGRNTNDGLGVANAYVSYQGAPNALPTTTPHAFTDSCTDDTSKAVPYVPVQIDSSAYPGNNTELDVSAPFRVAQPDGTNVFRWNIGNKLPEGMNIQFENPSVKILAQNQTLPASYNSYFIDGANSTAYWVIVNQSPIAHPIHLHLHDFNVISQGPGALDETTPLNWVNPPRRDVAMLPGNGHLFIAFKADNPGIALMHCHIAWHVAEGLSLQLVERKDEIFGYTKLDAAFNRTCTKFTDWYFSDNNPYGNKTDSGLRTRPPTSASTSASSSTTPIASRFGRF
ncbi:laccase [Auriculariales sp. MPI-PUGE-AT-0066]|nr:laccase [Auriculariales sp. MPI-PUGE-AT-0066]